MNIISSVQKLLLKPSFIKIAKKKRFPLPLHQIYVQEKAQKKTAFLYHIRTKTTT